MSRNVITFTWLIMGHGKVIRYAKTRDTMEFNPTSNEFMNFGNMRYLSMSLPQDEAKASPANGWQAINSVFKSIHDSVNSMTQIEDLCEYYENYVHYNNPLWTIYNAIQPWEKYFTGYVDKKEEDAWKNNRARVEFNAGDTDYGNVTIGEARRGSSFRAELFSAAIDPVCTSGLPYTGNAFCRLMFVNIHNFSENTYTNIYYGDKTRCTKNGEINGDNYGFKIPNGLMSLSEIRLICIEKSKLVKNELNYENYTMKYFIYDSTCNSYDIEISPENERRMKARNLRMNMIETENIKTGIKKGGTNFDEFDFFEKIKEQSYRMMHNLPNKDDEDNFNNALDFVTNWSPEGRGGAKIYNGRKKRNRKVYKKTNKNKKSKKQQKTRTRNNRRTRK